LTGFQVIPRNFAVVANGRIFFGDETGAELAAAQIGTAAQLAELAIAHHVRTLFVCPGSQLFEEIRAAGDAFAASSGGWECRPAQLMNKLTLWRDGKRVYVVCPGIVSEQWALDSITDPRELYATVETLQGVLGVTVTTPTATAKQLAQICATREPSPLPVETMAPFKEHIERDLYYLRPLFKDEEKKKYAHAYDKRSMYLSCAAIPLGMGAPSHHVADVPRLSYPDTSLPGLWKVNASPDIQTSSTAAQMLGELRGAWVYSPMLALYVGNHYRVEVMECYTFGKGARPLEHWYKVIRHALDDLPDKSPASKCLKAAYTHFIGWLSHTPANAPAGVPDKRRPEPYYRPDWRSMIISKAKERLTRNLLKVHEASGALPFIIRVDTVVYMSDEPNASKALPAPLTGDGAEYRHTYTAPAARVRELIGAKLSADRIDDALKGEFGI
jgi:hypothetical protein